MDRRLNVLRLMMAGQPAQVGEVFHVYAEKGAVILRPPPLQRVPGEESDFEAGATGVFRWCPVTSGDGRSLGHRPCLVAESLAAVLALCGTVTEDEAAGMACNEVLTAVNRREIGINEKQRR